jgi:pSer/pThr/pTyr-binding forkhead associated (FHA) protein
MQLRFRNAKGIEISKQLGSEPVTIGRSPEVTVVLEDRNASRRHCEVRQWEDDYVVKDLGSRNGTNVNGRRVDVAVLHIGDEISVGDSLLIFEDKLPLGNTTALRQVEHKMDEEGKGYNTIMREIVHDIEEDKPATDK